MPFQELAYFTDVKRKAVKTQRHTITAPWLFIVFENFRIRFILHAKVKVFFMNVKVTLLPQFKCK